jgi:hypothetical protein
VTAERYTAVFTGLLSVKRPGEYLHLAMREDPRGRGCTGTLCRGRPPYAQLGRELPFTALPEGCRRLVLDAYRELWGL